MHKIISIDASLKLTIGKANVRHIETSMDEKTVKINESNDL